MPVTGWDDSSGRFSHSADVSIIMDKAPSVWGCVCGGGRGTDNKKFFLAGLRVQKHGVIISLKRLAVMGLQIDILTESHYNRPLVILNWVPGRVRRGWDSGGPICRGWWSSTLTNPPE